MRYSALCDGNWWVGRVDGRGRYSALCDGDCWVGRVDGRGGPIDSLVEVLVVAGKLAFTESSPAIFS